MIDAIMQWCLGFVVVLLLLRFIRSSLSGAFAWSMITIVPWAIGRFIMMLVNKTMCG